MKAVVIGASGLVGKELVKLLLQSKKYEQVCIVVRKKISIVHPKLVQYRIIMSELDVLPSDIFANAHVFCALGTTMKKAKTKENFRAVDFDYVLEFAKLAKQYGLASFTLVSAMGANAKSMIFYSRVKGEIEQALLDLKLPKLFVIRPSLILGERHEERFGEQLAAWWSKRLTWLFKGSLQRYAPIDAKQIAEAMYKLAWLAKEPNLLVQSHHIAYWAKKK